MFIEGDLLLVGGVGSHVRFSGSGVSLGSCSTSIFLHFGLEKEILTGRKRIMMGQCRLKEFCDLYVFLK